MYQEDLITIYPTVSLMVSLLSRNIVVSCSSVIRSSMRSLRDINSFCSEASLSSSPSELLRRPCDLYRICFLWASSSGNCKSLGWSCTFPPSHLQVSFPAELLRTHGERDHPAPWLVQRSWWIRQSNEVSRECFRSYRCWSGGVFGLMLRMMMHVLNKRERKGI